MRLRAVTDRFPGALIVSAICVETIIGRMLAFRWGEQRMSKIIIDGKEIDVPAEYTLLQACEAAGAEIPRFCFHERLSIAGNCRMCLVEVKGGPPKPTASCAMAVKDLAPRPERRTAGRADQLADGPQSAQRHDGVSADQPSA